MCILLQCYFDNLDWTNYNILFLITFVYFNPYKPDHPKRSNFLIKFGVLSHKAITYILQKLFKKKGHLLMTFLTCPFKRIMFSKTLSFLKEIQI